MHKLVAGLVLSVVVACGSAAAQNQDASTQTRKDGIARAVDAGEFRAAKRELDQRTLPDAGLPLRELPQYRLQREVLDRIQQDFSKSERQVADELRRTFPGLTDAMMRAWEHDKKLEMRVIDGERRYFKNAVDNLFRLDAAARRLRYPNGAPREPHDLFLEGYLPSLLEKGGQDAVRFNVRYKLVVKPNAVPEGETVRCWLPFPRSDEPRQTEVKLLSVNVKDYVVSPNAVKHASVYCEKKAEKDRPTTFEVAYSFQSRAVRPLADETQVKPYVRNELYRRHTGERGPHIVFTDRIRRLSKEIVGEETNPYRVVRKIYEYVDARYPWASALEYSTIPSIPEYVMENGHGDCGMVTLLFMTLARYNGIPCKWQSGWMLHPKAVNLHDWCEVYFEGVGWVPLDQSFGLRSSPDERVKYFFMTGTDPYHFVVNDDFSADFYPAKIHPRSETVDFQRGEVEWRGGNLYFDRWTYEMKVEYEKP